MRSRLEEFQEILAISSPSYLGWAVIIVAVPILMLTIPGDAHIEPAFWSTAAQIIPVLILALAVESRAWGVTELDRPAAVGTFTQLGIGEAIALAYTASPPKHPAAIAFVAAPVLGGFVGLILIALRREKAEQPKTSTDVGGTGEG